jgi:hypothetical protein
MKKLILLLVFLVPVSFLFAQQSRVQFGGGYVFANIEDANSNGSGWRINGNYEYQPAGGWVAYGITASYVSIVANNNGNEYTVNTVPIYFTPRFFFGEGNFKPYLKGVLGFQFSDIKREGTLATFTGNDAGLNFGAGAGLQYNTSGNLFLNLDYELMYVMNGFYRDGLLNSVNLGIGFNF